jgi:hypothetical protein
MIRKIIKEDDYRHRHHSDVERLQRVMLQNGYEADLRSAAGIWEDYSDDYAAGWLGMPDDDEELWQTIEHRVEREAQ